MPSCFERFCWNTALSEEWQCVALHGFGRLVVQIAYVNKFLKAVLLVCASLREDLWSDAKEDAARERKGSKYHMEGFSQSNECSAACLCPSVSVWFDVPATKHCGHHSN